MSKLISFAAPILPGKEETWRKFRDELRGKRNAEFNESRKKAGVHERTFHQQTPHGELCIITLEGDDPMGSFQKMAHANDEFTKWFIAQVKDIHGFDMTAPPPGPMPELVVDSAS